MTQEYELPPLPEKSYLGDDVSYGYEPWDMQDYALAAIELDRQQRGEPVGEVAEIRGERVADISTWELECLPLGTKLYAAPQPAAPVVKESLTVAVPAQGVSDADNLHSLKVAEAFNSDIPVTEQEEEEWKRLEDRK